MNSNDVLFINFITADSEVRLNPPNHKAKPYVPFKTTHMNLKLTVFIVLFSMNLVYSQSRCDTSNTNQIFIAAEKGAEPNISGEELQVLLNTSIDKELLRPRY